jgi:hypothetical protein
VIDRDQQGKLTLDSKTALAISGMPPSETADKMALYELQYRRCIGVDVDDEGHVTRARIDSLARYERNYQEWLGVKVDDEGHMLSTRWYTGLKRLLARWFAPLEQFRADIARAVEQDSEIIAIFRAEILELIERNTELVQDARARGQQEQFYGIYLELVQREKHLYSYLYEHHRRELADGQARQMTLVEIAKGVMSRLAGELESK